MQITVLPLPMIVSSSTRVDGVGLEFPLIRNERLTTKQTGSEGDPNLTQTSARITIYEIIYNSKSNNHYRSENEVK